MINFDTSPYFVSFQPYQFPSGTIPVTSINDMVSFSPEIPTSSISIDYNIGATGDYSFTYIIKNVTSNTKISASLVPNQYFTPRVLTPIIHTSSNGFVLNPSQTGSILISLNTSSLTSAAGQQAINGNVILRISNVGPPTASFRNVTTTLITASKLTSPIEVL